MRRPVVCIFMVFILILCCAASSFADSDIDYNEWNSGGIYPADVLGTQLLTPVKFLMDKKIITGDTDGLFHPDKNITRAEFATMVAKATNNIAELDRMENAKYFNDLEGYSWAKGYINAVAKAGLFNGRSDSKFAPGESVTYAEAITVIVRIRGGSGDMPGKWPDNYISFAETYNMLGDIVVNDWNSPANKGDVAKLLYRVLPKD